MTQERSTEEGPTDGGAVHGAAGQGTVSEDGPGARRVPAAVGRVVAGVGEVEADRPAVTWAAQVARDTGAALHLVHVVPDPVTADVAARWFDADLERYVHDTARSMLEDLAADVEGDHLPTARVTWQVVRDRPRAALREAAEGASLLVCGAGRRHWLRRHAFPGLQLGSTTLYLAAHLSHPVAVVRALPPVDARGVVVGDDGSPAAVAAVEDAAERAEALAEPLRIVRTWRSVTRRTGGWDRRVREELQAAEEQAQESSVAERAAAVRAAHPDLRVDVDLLEGVDPGGVLVEFAAHARLLVIGARGHGAFTSAFLGSTSHDVLHRATGPVVVVPDAARVAEAATADEEVEGAAEETTGSRR